MSAHDLAVHAGLGDRLAERSNESGETEAACRRNRQERSKDLITRNITTVYEALGDDLSVARAPSKAAANAMLAAMTSAGGVHRLPQGALLAGPAAYGLESGPICELITAAVTRLARNFGTNWSPILLPWQPQANQGIGGANVSRLLAACQIRTGVARLRPQGVQVGREEYLRCDGAAAFLMWGIVVVVAAGTTTTGEPGVCFIAASAAVDWTPVEIPASYRTSRVGFKVPQNHPSHRKPVDAARLAGLLTSAAPETAAEVAEDKEAYDEMMGEKEWLGSLV